MRILFIYTFLVMCKTPLFAQQINGYNNNIIVNIVQNALKQNPSTFDSIEWKKNKAIWKEKISLLNFETKNKIAVHLWNLNKTDELIHYYNALKKLPEIFFKNYDERRIFKLTNNVESLAWLRFRKSNFLEGAKSINSYQNYNHYANEMLGKIALLKKDYETAFRYFLKAEKFPLSVGYLPCGKLYYDMLWHRNILKAACQIQLGQVQQMIDSLFPKNAHTDNTVLILALQHLYSKDSLQKMFDIAFQNIVIKPALTNPRTANLYHTINSSKGGAEGNVIAEKVIFYDYIISIHFLGKEFEILQSIKNEKAIPTKEMALEYFKKTRFYESLMH